MSKRQVYVIQIPKFDEYHQKAKGRPVQWLRLDARMYRSPEFLMLPSGCKLGWIWLLSEAAQTRTREVLVETQQFSREIHVKPSSVPGVLHVLSDIEWIHIVKEPYVRTNVRTKRTNDSHRGQSATPPPPVENKSALPAKQENGGLLVAHYCDSWKARYRSEKSPPIMPQHAKALKGLMDQVGFERARDLVRAYLSMPEQWFLTKSHDIPTLIGNLNKVTQFLETGRMVTKSEIQQVDKNVAQMNLRSEIQREGV